MAISFPTAQDLLAEHGYWLLSLAEYSVAALAAAGRSNQEIAAERATSERTIANQLASVYRKLGINSRSELAARWHGSAPDS